MTLELRPAAVEDVAGICALLDRASPGNPKRDPQLLRWQYWRNPFGAPSSWVWTEGRRVVAHSGGFAVPLVLDGRAARGDWGADAATDPAYRRRGLFTAAARARFEAAADAGIAATVSLPLARSWPALQAAGLRPATRLRVYVLPRGAATARRVGLPAIVPRIAGWLFPARTATGADESAQLPHDLGDLLERTPRPRYGIARTVAWWRWRYAQRPNAAYRYLVVRHGARLLACAVTVERARGRLRLATVLDVAAVDHDAGAATIGAVAAAHAELDGVAVAAPPGSFLAAVARRGGCRRLPGRLEPETLRLGVVDHAGTLRDVGRLPWTVSWGDVDWL